MRDRRFESKYAYRNTLLIKLKKQYNTRTISNGWIRIYTKKKKKKKKKTKKEKEEEEEDK